MISKKSGKKVMRIYCPYKTNCWGDWITTIWAAEYIKAHLPGAIICIDDAGVGHKLRVVDSNISDWADEFINSADPWDINKYDYILCTHHRHAIDVHYTEPYRKIYFDCSGMILKFILENWYPSFCPTKALIKQFENLKLPKEYNVIHYSRCCWGFRNKDKFDVFIKKHEWLWRNTNNTVCTGENIPNCINMSKMHGWLKIYIMLRAKNIYVRHSGFTHIASMWRKRENSYVIDADLDSLEFGPPTAAYTNVKITGDLKPIYYYLENHPFKDYYAWSTTDGIVTSPGVKKRGLYADFKIIKDESPPDYVTKKVYLDIENCPLPFDYEFKYEDIND
jgi:hypothetical protein